MKVVTFYADCDLPDLPRKNQSGFDWRKAIEWLRKSAAQQGYETVVVSDQRTDIEADIRVGDAKASGLMLWILQAQAEAIRLAEGPSVIVSPDSLVKGSLDGLMGDWDVALLTRRRPKPIVNSVIGFRPSEALHGLWLRMLDHAKRLPADSIEWGADIDALVSYLKISASETGQRTVDGVRVRLLPMRSVFTSVNRDVIERPRTPVWDFKGPRKKLMARYAELP